MQISACSKATLRLGIVTLVVSALSSVWELLAVQSPGTPLYIATLPGPIVALRELTTVVGLVLLGAGNLIQWNQARVEPKGLVVLMYAGTALGVGAQTYAALHGMHGVQLKDLRPDALPLFLIKYGGLGLLFGALLELGRRILWRIEPRSAASSGPATVAAEAPANHTQAGTRQLDSEETHH